MTFGAPRVASRCATPIASESPYLEGTVSRFTPLALVLSLIPVCLAAQESSSSDTTSFHGGQWGMQFGGGSSLFSLGVLRFTSSRSAWLLDVATSGQFLDATSTDKLGGGTTPANEQFVNVDVRLGRRFYQTPRRKVVSFQTLAVEGGFSDQMVDFPQGNARQTISYRGGNAEIGGAYMVTSALSLGGTGRISVGHYTVKRDNPAVQSNGKGWYVNGIRVLFALGLYF
jgi:hypothetical protein